MHGAPPPTLPLNKHSRLCSFLAGLLVDLELRGIQPLTGRRVRVHLGLWVQTTSCPTEAKTGSGRATAIMVE